MTLATRTPRLPATLAVAGVLALVMLLLTGVQVGAGKLELETSEDHSRLGEEFMVLASLPGQGNVSTQLLGPGNETLFLGTRETDENGSLKLALRSKEDWVQGNYTIHAAASYRGEELHSSSSIQLLKLVPQPDLYLDDKDIWLWAGSVLHNNTVEMEGDTLVWDPGRGLLPFVSVQVHNSGELEATGTLSLYHGSRTQGNLLGSESVTVGAGSNETLVFGLDPALLTEKETRFHFLAYLEDIEPEDTKASNNRASRLLTVRKQGGGEEAGGEDGISVDVVTQPPVLATATVSLFLVAAVTLTETGRYRFFSPLMLLFTRLTRKDIEKDIREQNIRGMIYQHIRENPGTTYAVIQRSVGAPNGTLCYHLKKLQELNFIRGKDVKGKKYYWMSDLVFPGGTKRPMDEYPPLNPNQKNIVHALLSGSSFTVKELSDITKIPRSTVNSTLHQMRIFGMVSKDGTFPVRYGITASYEQHYHNYEARVGAGVQGSPGAADQGKP